MPKSFSVLYVGQIPKVIERTNRYLYKILSMLKYFLQSQLNMQIQQIQGKSNVALHNKQIFHPMVNMDLTELTAYLPCGLTSYSPICLLRRIPGCCDSSTFSSKWFYLKIFWRARRSCIDKDGLKIKLGLTNKLLYKQYGALCILLNFT